MEETVTSPRAGPQVVRRKVREVQIVVLEDRCKGCGFCIDICPFKVLDFNAKLNLRGAHPPYVKSLELCTGCGLCEEICPDLSIFLREGY